MANRKRKGQKTSRQNKYRIKAEKPDSKVWKEKFEPKGKHSPVICRYNYEKRISLR